MKTLVTLISLVFLHLVKLGAVGLKGWSLLRDRLGISLWMVSNCITHHLEFLAFIPLSFLSVLLLQLLLFIIIVVVVITLF